MTRALKTVAVLLVTLMLAAACQSMTGKTAGQNLVADSASNLTRVNVDTNNATVYLNGTVETPEQKARAEQLAWQAKGVKSVVNNLQVQKK
jgi:osmotically-inducible protein OsmY